MEKEADGRSAVCPILRDFSVLRKKQSIDIISMNNVECICVAMYFANFFTSSCSSSKVIGDFSLLDGVFLLN